MAFTIDEVLLLENITYFTDEAPMKNTFDYDGKTVKQLLDDIKINALVADHQYSTYMTGKDFLNLILAMRNNKRICESTIHSPHFDDAYGGGGGISVVFINEELKEAVVAFRGTADNEWQDDFVGANQTDSLQQINSLEWYKKAYEKNNLQDYFVTVTGHSKGGNKAKYITILDDTPNRCVSFDGQGFSDKFIESYKDRIIERQHLIENHNVDFDYVNIILSDIGKKTYYIGFDYGEGGFAEAHCPNTFFDFKDNGKYEMRINPNGQAPEMQILDQFINSMVRSNLNDKETSETTYVVGKIVEKAFQIGTTLTTNDFLIFLVDFIGIPQFSDNVAYLVVFIIKYTKDNPELMQAFKNILIHFHMDQLVDVIDDVANVLESQKINAILNLSNFLVSHANGLVVKKVQSIAKKKYDLELTKDQIKGVLNIVLMTKEMMKTVVLAENSSDLVVEDIAEEKNEEFVIPEKLDIVVLAGGLSNERNVSLITGFAVMDALKAKGHNVILVDAYMGYDDHELLIEDPFSDPEKYSFDAGEVTNDVADLWAVKKRRTAKTDAFFGPNVISICRHADLVFIALKGANGENGKVQATLDLLGIDYTGCNSFASGITLNKAVAKLVMNSVGIPVPKGFSLRKDDKIPNPKDYSLNYPLVIKPCNGGIGVGVSVVSDKNSYQQALKNAFKWENEVVVEEYVSGRQFAVGTLDGKALPVIEVLPLSTTDKEVGLNASGKEVKKCPAKLEKGLAKKLQTTALEAAHALGINGYSLADFIVRPDGSFVCLECDTLPELTESSLFVLEAEAAGISFPDLCEKIMELSLTE